MNKLAWLTEDVWVQGDDIFKEKLPYTHMDRQTHDLYTAVRVSALDDAHFDYMAEKLVTAFSLAFPDKYSEIKEKHYYKDKGKLVFRLPLYAINDSLNNFSELKKLLFYV